MPPRSLPSPLRRVPAARRAGPTPPPPPPDDGLALRLAIARDGIGLELARPARLACFSVTDFSATLPGIRFPVDVSGGVPRFRHRRGELQRLELELRVRSLERWAAPRLRGVVGTRTPEVWVSSRRGAATVCLTATADAEDESSRERPILAFEVHALAEGQDMVLVVDQARGTDLPRPATALAVTSIEWLLGGAGHRQGSTLVVRGAATAILKALLPEAGARVPAADEVRFTSVAADGETWVLQAIKGALSALPTEEGLRAREISSLLREADETLVFGDDEAARALYVDALERAPRHPEIVRRIVDLDLRAGGRSEAALALLADALRPGSSDGDARLGTMAGELLAQTGDVQAALASLERAGDSEPAPALAARAYELAARVATDPEDAARWLDRALARSARSTSARWSRVTRRLQLGRLEDAMADVEHLEAQARGARVKHAVWLRAGRAWHAAGLSSRSAGLFERALRFVPDEPRALAGLGAALVGEGSHARGVSVLERALDLARARGEATSAILLELGRALAEKLGDLSTGVAHVSAIPADTPEGVVARGLEGRWRGRLGDLAGAALAFARLRELASSLPLEVDDPRGLAAAQFLGEAAELETSRLFDPLAGQRHLAAALRLRPRHPELLRAYREVGALIAQQAADPAPSLPLDDDSGPSAPRPTPAETPLPDRSTEPEPEEVDVDAGVAARIEDLTRRLQGNPADDAVADELASLLERAGRGHELLALLSARLEDATPERRPLLVPRAKAALERLASEAERANRLEEAALYRSAMGALSR